MRSDLPPANAQPDDGRICAAGVGPVQYANRARNIQNKPVVNRDANSMVINELREKVQALATELLRIRSGGGGDGGDGTGGGVSAETLRELAVASTPARQPQKPLTRASSSRSGTMDASAAVQRELAVLRARAAEAEGEVARLTEEAKRARRRESDKDDLVAGLRAELDLAHADNLAISSGTGTDQLMLDIAELAAGNGGDGGGGSPATATAGAGTVRATGERLHSSGSENVSPKVGFGGVIKGFFGGSGGSNRSKSPSHAGGVGGGNGNGKPGATGDEGGEAATPSGARGSSSSDANPKPANQEEAPREKARAVVKDFHRRIQGLEERLNDSERQRAALERQLVHNSGGGGGGAGAGDGVGGAGGLTVGLSAKLAAAAAGDTGELSMDAVAEAKKRYESTTHMVFLLIYFV